VPPASRVPDVRLSFDEAAVLLALLELLPDDPASTDLCALRDRWRERLRARMVESVSERTPSVPG
jgi:hypothetical protein